MGLRVLFFIFDDVGIALKTRSFSVRQRLGKFEIQMTKPGTNSKSRISRKDSARQSPVKKVGSKHRSAEAIDYLGAGQVLARIGLAMKAEYTPHACE